MKKIIILICCLFSMALMTSCSDSADKIKLPDLTGKTREEIKEILDDANIKFKFKFDEKIVYNDEDRNKFTKYNGDLEAGQLIDKDYLVYVYTTVLPLTFSNYQDVKMDFEYEGKSYIDDNAGVVTLVSVSDGDTAVFRDLNGTEFRLRFLGVDTPETHYGEDPWGQAASDFTKNILRNAKQIVIEAGKSKTETYGRYLGFVWVDGILLNLRLINEAYTNSTLGNEKYSSYFLEASMKAQATGRRFFGETDPNYDYENKKFK